MAYRETARTRARKQAIRQRLLEATETLVAQEGFRGAPVARVAELAGIATGTVYRHFDSKGDLFSEVFQRATAREVARVDEALQEPGNAVERLDRALEVFAARALRAPTMAWALIAEPVDPQVDQERLIYRQTYARLFARTLSDGIQAGELPPQNVELASAAIVGAIAEALIGPLSPMAQNPEQYSPQQKCAQQLAPENLQAEHDRGAGADLVRAIVTFCLQAVRAEKHSPGPGTY